MDFYGRIINVQGPPDRPTLFIRERRTTIIKKITIVDIHFFGLHDNYLDILANGNLLTDNEPEKIEIFVILEIHCQLPVNEANPLSKENLLDREVFVHSRF